MNGGATWTDERLDDRFDSIGQRFDSVDQRFDSVDRRFDSLERRFDSLESRFDALQRTMILVGGGTLATLISVLATGV